MKGRASAAIVVLAGVASAVAAGAPPVVLAASGLPLTEFNCYNPFQANADFEAYGPTDVNVQAGNGRVTVNENDHGTITVFKYPNPSYYNQVKYFGLSRNHTTGAVGAQFPNEGSFAGIVYHTSGGTGFNWLRDWQVTQQYDSQDVPVPVSVYHAPANLGLTVTDVDLTPPGLDTLEREFWVQRESGSAVTSASLVYFENFNPVANRIIYLPITDWCLTKQSDQQAMYDSASHSIVHSWSGADSTTGQPTSVAFAFGFDGTDQAHQVGEDAYDPNALTGQAPDGYVQASSAPYALGGSDAATGQVTGTLQTDLNFDATGRASARLTVAGGTTTGAALAALGTARGQTFNSQMSAVKSDWHGWLQQTHLPVSTDPRVVEVAKRALISIRVATAPDTGAIVASANTQGPYGEDWTRDGSFINQVLDYNGFHDAVTRHNLFYARIQTSATNPSPLRPSGNWAMTSYADGVDGGPIPYEIDETGLAAWALWNHHAYLDPAVGKQYLEQVYPAITNAAIYMTSCEDPTTGMQCSANEDDNVTPSQTMHGAETVYLGLESAIAAAQAMGDSSPQVSLWQARLGRLRSAIAALYDPQTGAYREGNNTGNAYNTDFGDGGWLLWPVQFRPYSDATMIAEANDVQKTMDASLASQKGSYEQKGLLGLAHAWSSPTAAQRAELLGKLSYMAALLTTPTGHFGESWIRLTTSRPQTEEDMPHVWEQSLFYLAAIQINGATPYSFDSSDYYLQNLAPGAPPMTSTGAGLPSTTATMALELWAACFAGLVALAIGLMLTRRRRMHHESGAAGKSVRSRRDRHKLPAWLWAEAPAAFVHQAMMPATEKQDVVFVGLAAVYPEVEVVPLTPLRGAVTVGEAAALIARHQRPAQRRRHGPHRPAQVQVLALAIQQKRSYRDVAAEAPGSLLGHREDALEPRRRRSLQTLERLHRRHQRQVRALATHFGQAPGALQLTPGQLGERVGPPLHRAAPVVFGLWPQQRLQRRLQGQATLGVQQPIEDEEPIPVLVEAEAAPFMRPVGVVEQSHRVEHALAWRVKWRRLLGSVPFATSSASVSIWGAASGLTSSTARAITAACAKPISPRVSASCVAPSPSSFCATLTRSAAAPEVSRALFLSQATESTAPSSS